MVIMAQHRAAPLLLGLIPDVCEAHSPIEGIGHFYGGLAHPALVMPHLLLLLAFALLIGQNGIRAMRFGYPPFFLALAITLSCAGLQIGPDSATLQTALLVATIIAGILVAIGCRLNSPLLTLAAVLVAGLIGLDSGVEGLTRQQTFAALLGCWFGAGILVIVAAGAVELLHRDWQLIGVRIVGSWIAASGLLVLTLTLHQAGP